MTLVWGAPTSGDAVLAYVLEAGSASGTANLANIATNSTATTFSASGIGAGTYFVRVRAQNGGGVSPPSNEVVVVVSTIGCVSSPSAPSGLNVTVSGTTVTLTWTAPVTECSATSYVLQAGSGPGLSNLADFNTGNSATTYVATGVGQGMYFVRVRAVNGNGTSGPSNEVSFTGGGGVLGPGPGMMTATIDGVAWSGRITVASIATGNFLVVSATGSPGMTTIAVSTPAQVGTQTVGFANPLTGALVISPTVGWLAASAVGSGSMTVSSLTATSATGTFFFSLEPNSGVGPNRIITNGAFNARIPTP